MITKTNELTGAALDWAVGRCIGEYKPVSVPAYSTDWSLCGPIIEREKITLEHRGDSGGWRARIWSDGRNNFVEVGCRGPYCPTPLIAAMRCFVTSKLGDDVDVPEELI